MIWAARTDSSAGTLNVCMALQTGSSRRTSVARAGTVPASRPVITVASTGTAFRKGLDTAVPWLMLGGNDEGPAPRGDAGPFAVQWVFGLGRSHFTLTLMILLVPV